MIMAGTQRQSRSARWLVLLILLLLLLAGGYAAVTFVLPRLANAPASNPVADEPQSAPLVFAPSGLIGSNDRLLLWVGTGAGPGQHSAADPGDLVFMDSAGATEPVMEVPPQSSRIMPCGDQALSPNGNFFAYYMGHDAGNLYMMTNAQSPILLDDNVEGLGCLGNGSFQYSPNSERLAYISYVPGASTQEFAEGTLRIYSTSDMTEVASFESVTAFDLNNDGAAFVSFFTNDRNEADEAGVLWWDGSTDREVSTLVPNEGCRFTTAQVGIANDGKLIVVMGHRCRSGDTRTQWQFYSVDPSNRSANLAASDFQEGAFLPYARTNNVIFSPDGQTAYFTIPDGVTANTAALVSVNLSDMSYNRVVERQAVMPTFSGAPNAFPRISNDGKWLAMVVTSPGNENTLTVFNLDEPDVPPIEVSAGSSGDVISNFAFTSDNNKILYIAGGDNAEDNSLVLLDLSNGSETRVRRGRFGSGMALAPDGSEVIVTDWQVPEDPAEPAFLNLLVVNVSSSEETTLYEGADLVDGKVENQRFAHPLAWRRT